MTNESYLGQLAKRHYCAMRFVERPPLAQMPGDERARVILKTQSKWPNGSVLTYGFLGGAEPQRAAVRGAFAEWKALGIGLSFHEAGLVSQAQIRISFDPKEGSWSYIGTECRTIESHQATMNFGWDLRTDYGHTTALHEIGHALGLPHEHQNPFAGIVWNEEAVYAELGGPPNRWSRQTTYDNILAKIAPDSVQGSRWDPDSVMHYAFDAGLIEAPAAYAAGLQPAGGLSAQDKAWVQHFYPAIDPESVQGLALFQSRLLALKPGESVTFEFVAPASRRYTFATVGEADTLLALAKANPSPGLPPLLLGEDDDSGDERNAMLKVALKQGDRVQVQVRIRYIEQLGEAALMVTY